ncbi:GspE/PulE family protein [Pseudoalteromonas xiamenensis]|uniref:GspE/PulE family protein n=1 Tax=Pseudoalteromonas xiamenensis TaxID=882626 RepID=UPI0035EE7841
MQLAELLIESYGISASDLEKASTYQQRNGGRLEQILLNMGSLAEENLPKVIAEAYNFSLLDISLWEEQLDSYSNTKHGAFLHERKWVVLKSENQHWTFATSNPLDLEVSEWISLQGITPTIFVGAESDIQTLISAVISTAIEDENYSLDEEERLKELATEAPVVNLLNTLMSRALRQGASDMHVEPNKGSWRVRYRVDGVLHEAERIPTKLQKPLITRLKILSGMDIAEKRRPQDGKIETRIANQEIDIRVSALPLNDGESIVMRFLRKDNVKYDMAVLGLSTDIENQIKRDIKCTAGVILLTGPTGSGKTTTLYTFLNALNSDDVKIITLEDPVEYQLEGINQVQVNSEIGFDFSAGLRSIVRQDPDIIMLGEIRDRETAQIALQSALTGHLVFSTVHTNDAASAYTRLLDLGVEEFLLNAALVSIVAQRLVRKLCIHCSESISVEEAKTSELNLTAIAQRFNIERIDLRKAKGCEHCNQTGYKGRMAITEYLGCDEVIRSIPKDENFIAQAKKHNEALNRRTLLEDGMLKALQGYTTIDEVFRVAG